MPHQASPALSTALAPDLVALFLGATPHPDIVIPEPRVTIADLAAAARAAWAGTSATSGVSGVAGPATGPELRWDAAGQRFAP